MLKATPKPSELIERPNGQPGRKTKTGADGRIRGGFNIAKSMNLDITKPEDKKKWLTFQVSLPPLLIIVELIFDLGFCETFSSSICQEV